MRSERRLSRFPERIRRPPRLSRMPSFLREVGGIAVHPPMLGRIRSHYLATIGTTGHFNLVERDGFEPSVWFPRLPVTIRSESPLTWLMPSRASKLEALQMI
jgi:hypothetical protein